MVGDGWLNIDPSKQPDWRRPYGGIKIWTHDIPEYLTQAVLWQMEWYVKYKERGNPWNDGWMCWPYWADEIIEVLDAKKRSNKN